MASFIYATDSSRVAIAEGGVYAPTSIVRRMGNKLSLSNNGISINEAGYYDIKTIANVVASEVGTVTVEIAQDNNVLDSKTVSATEISEQLVIPVESVALVRCGCIGSNITIIVNGQQVTSASLSIIVTKRN